MKPEDINVSDTYYVRLQVDCITSDIIYVTFLDMQHNRVQSVVFNKTFARAISPINAENGTEIAEPAPKYDPCRPFKAGDIVTPSSVKGRWFDTAWKDHREIRFTVTKAENEEGTMWVQKADSSTPIWVLAAFFQLVTPVEELERYVVIHNDYEKYYEVCWKDDDEPDGRTGRTRCLTIFWYHNPPKTYTQEEARAAAQAECDRLNAEYRAQNTEQTAQNAEQTAQNAEYRKEEK